MQELIPHISCLVNPHEFDEAVKSTYSDIYIVGNDGYYRHKKLKGERFVRLKVDKIPGAGAEVKASIEEELNFLPNGKIPFSFFEQIMSFFKKVMELKNAEYEAHCWILWNKEKGYYISVPKQTVSKASVNFVYDNDALPPGDIIVVDIHSHNTMGAFFSGTDDNNDKSGIYFSGVIGKLKDKEPATIFRFNLYETKRKCGLEDIFEVEKEAESAVPQEWLDQVEVKSYSTSSYPSKRFDPSSRTFTDRNVDLYSGYSDYYRSCQRQPSLWNETAEYGRNKHGLALYPWEYPENEDDALAILNDQERDLDRQAEEHLRKVLASEDEDEDNDDPVGSNMGSEYDYYNSKYGVDVADAKDGIETELSSMEGCDEGLVDIIRQCYEMLGDEGRSDLANNGF